MKAAPVEYVKVCPTYGPGFYYIPGTTTCIKVGGSFYSEVYANQRFKANNDLSGWNTKAGVSLDARDNTEYGLLRTVVAPSWQSRVGTSTGGSTTTIREGLTIAPNYGGVAVSTAGALRETQINVVAYVQFGGFTMGRLASLASPSFAPTSNIGYEANDARYQMNTLAYTASLGNGITASVGIEDGTSGNRDGILTVASNAVATTQVNYGAVQVPDAFGKIAVDQSWGSLNLAGIVHQINYDTYQFPNSGTDMGYGVQGAAKINLPMLSAGDYLFANLVYASGFNQLVWANLTGDRNSGDTSSVGIGRVGGTLNDVVLESSTGRSWQAKSYGGAAEFGHYFTPTVVGFVGASYAKIDWDSSARLASAASLAAASVVNPSSLTRVNVGVQWQPVKNFKIQPEVTYLHIAATTASNAGITTEGAAKKTENQFISRIRMTRDF
jgi:Porin subfamily